MGKKKLKFQNSCIATAVHAIYTHINIRFNVNNWEIQSCLCIYMNATYETEKKKRFFFHREKQQKRKKKLVWNEKSKREVLNSSEYRRLAKVEIITTTTTSVLTRKSMKKKMVFFWPQRTNISEMNTKYNSIQYINQL